MKAKAKAAAKDKMDTTTKPKAKAKAKATAEEPDHVGPKKKQAKLSTEQKQLKSRKSIAYHHARKVALEEGKTTDEAKLIAQAVFLNAISKCFYALYGLQTQ